MKKILVVDDEPELRSIVVRALRGVGYSTIEAESGADAFDLALKDQPDLILSDVMMDCGSGFMLREMLRDEQKTAGIPLILMTGRVKDAGAWRAEPGVGYLEKPFTVSELFAAVSPFLKQISRK